MSPRPGYDKPWQSFDQQVEILRRRGFSDAGEYRAQIQQIGYYRLSGYWYSFRQLDPATHKRRDHFFPDARMAHVVALYDFDAALRGAVWDVVTLDSFVPLPGLAPSAMGLVPGWHDEAIWNPRSA